MKLINIKMKYIKMAVSVLYIIMIYKGSQGTYTYSRFPVGISGSNNNMEYLVMDVSSD